MQLRRTERAGRGRGVAVCVAGVLLLAGCGSDRSDSSAPQEAVPDIACADGGQVRGSGSTAQQNAMSRWMQQYQLACPEVELVYDPVGSGAGVAQFQRGASAFGGTDEALSAQDVEGTKEVCSGGRAIDLPMVGGPIALGYNVPGVTGLVLDAPTLARIFDSRITQWNDPSIQRLNPGTKLPDLPVIPFHRTDDSGTTQNLNAYLKGAAPKRWPYPTGKKWQARGGESASGSDAVSSAVLRTDGAIGYFELSFAVRRKIDTVRIATGAAEPVAPSTTSASVGIAEARIAGTGKDLSMRFNYRTSAEGAYPIVLVTYEVVCDTGNPADSLPALKSFLTYTAGEEGQKQLHSIHYAPLPASVAVQVREVVSSLS
ncbi:phosphate ABC transporter substrate-binding protein PstS [Streptomyces finlayi]|uniref:Phosphate-binding protein n=1 Tax=Streptomyces finlayi TaxID=67296 RepID=A0A7G7BPG7_9ACTN|nr:phosphate ABC transporter substrate-binding protein PstS [Streptomyces finlayi]QNE77232.1 phosphate ABC transporter substrate-binding protein PstS [Streptomyces finlayi]